MYFLCLVSSFVTRIPHINLMAALNSLASTLYLWSTGLSGLCHHGTNMTKQVMFLLVKKKGKELIKNFLYVLSCYSILHNFPLNLELPTGAMVTSV